MSEIFQPNSSATQTINVSKTLSANNATAQVQLFSVTGVVLINKLYGIVTTVLNSAITAAYFQINDGAATPDITLAAGVTISSAAVGSIIQKNGLAAAAAVFTNASAGAIVEPGSAGQPVNSPFMVVKKTGQATAIEFVYTKDAGAASGVIQFFAEFTPMSADGAMGAL